MERLFFGNSHSPLPQLGIRPGAGGGRLSSRVAFFWTAPGNIQETIGLDS